MGGRPRAGVTPFQSVSYRREPVETLGLGVAYLAVVTLLSVVLLRLRR
ncbi:hypothetical protein [Haladaptatus sp. DYF46]|nr:hypothetical protein [Haladaptatus sp. DYF46]